jgi:cell fate (sporulation/competence/biofilm development) regulator YlbF (YheA/YmcA/DUF963 family)
MDILDKAKELGHMIGDSTEMTTYKVCEAKVEQDEASQRLLNDYKLLQIEMVRATKENRDKSIIEAIKERLLGKQEEINNYKVTSDYLEAKSALDSLMKRVNDVMIFAITGEESCSPDKCGSCGGGCSK